jgi:hypothetical protein
VAEQVGGAQGVEEWIAYAIADLSGIQWAATGLRSPLRDGVVETKYFVEHYLRADPTWNREGQEIAGRIIAGLEAKRPRRAPEPVSHKARLVVERARVRGHLRIGLIGL